MNEIIDLMSSHYLPNQTLPSIKSINYISLNFSFLSDTKRRNTGTQTETTDEIDKNNKRKKYE